MSFASFDISKNSFSFSFDDFIKGILPNSIDGYEKLISLLSNKFTFFVLKFP